MNQEDTAKKKMSLQEAIKKQLENKKNLSGNGSNKMNASDQPKKLQSQQTKKISNQRRKMGV